MENLLEIIEKLNNNELPDIESCKRLVQYSLYDSVSGLKNRHAFDLKIKEIESSEYFRSVGVVFADVNALKFMNDHYGHNMGDDLIRKCGFLLISHFGKDNCYRVSGDEFIVLLDDVSSVNFINDFITNVAAFQKILYKKDIPPISIGYQCTEICFDMASIIYKAEERMRKNKETFYKKYPEFRR